ncbi:MAG: TonB-dependent siderophore receptor [Burkholderiales bacterium]|nr:TonB-dependent siderophore receptor [Burkholderiales bacterium]
MSQAPLFRLHHPSGVCPTLIALLSWTTCGAALAQYPSQTGSLPTVTVTAPSPRSGQADITGFGDTPAWQLPMQAQRYTDTALKNSGVQRLADLTSRDASISDSYNAQGYWDFLSVRGFVLDNAYNFRREGLPINAETSIPLDNKAAVEVLKGTSGMQAGVSSPGGLVNFVVKRPEGRVRSATLGLTGGRSVLTSVDLSDRFGESKALGLRINAANEHLNPSAEHAQGERHLIALAADLRARPGTLFELEIEHSHRSQPSVTGFSLLGDTLPSAKSIDPNTNLNHQPWSLPVVMNATTGTARWTQTLTSDWTLVSTLGSQRLTSQDRTVFPYGCAALIDRFCANGDYDVYDFRSEGEVRVTQVADLTLQGRLMTGSVQHQLRAGLQRSVHRTSLPNSAFNLIGTGNVYDESIQFAPDPSLGTPQTSRHSRNAEVSLSDQIALSPLWNAWLGLRHTQLRRDSALNDGSNPQSIDQRFTTPWAALGYTFAPKHQAYASWGEGVESKDVPNLGYANSGQALPAQKSRQLEAGLKGQVAQYQWGLNWFQTTRPQTSVDSAPNLLVMDGNARHRGFEGQVETQMGAWTLDASAMLLDAERRHSAINPALNGKKPVNVPDHTVKLSASYKVPAVTGLTLQGDVIHEGRRMVLDDNSIDIPAWTRVDAALRYTQALQQNSLTWRLGVYNLLDTRVWREAPNQFGHVYLFPMAPRTVTASLQTYF